MQCAAGDAVANSIETQAGDVSAYIPLCEISDRLSPPDSCRALREMPSPGKSGSVFFLSDDDRFLIKTVSHEEMLLLLKLIPAYYRHCADNPTTLLTRFFGVHRVKPLGSQSKAGLPSRLPASTELDRSPSLELPLKHSLLRGLVLSAVYVSPSGCSRASLACIALSPWLPVKDMVLLSLLL